MRLSLRLILSSVAFAFVLLPFLILLIYSITLPSAGHGIPFDAWQAAFINTMWQATLSALLSVIVGVAGAFGLQAAALHLGPRVEKLCEALALIPTAVPVLLNLLATMKVFPECRGLGGIVFVHMMLNAGIITLICNRLMRDKLSGMAELAWIEGASRWAFFRSGVWPVLKTDFAFALLFVFALCFSSFAVPLILGGSRATTLEVLIYQTIRIDDNWRGALAISLIQFGTIGVLSWIAWSWGRDTVSAEGSWMGGQSHGRWESAGELASSCPAPLMSWWPGLVFVMLPISVLILGLSGGVIQGFESLALNSLEQLWSDLSGRIIGSILVGFGVGVSIILILMALAYISSTGWLRRLMLGYMAPSSVLTGFALLILFRDQSVTSSIFRIVVGVSMIALPSFYRLYWDGKLMGLQGQRTVARSLGASDALIFRQVVLPQLVRPLFYVGGLAAFWSWGDFALSSVVAGRSITLAMLVHALAGSYRIDLAITLSCLIVLGGAFSFLVFVFVGQSLSPGE